MTCERSLYIHAADNNKMKVYYVPSARCAYAANVVGKDLDIFALGAVSLNYIYASNCK
jgi:hypothetical protein